MKKKILIILVIVAVVTACSAVFFRPVNLLDDGSTIENGSVLYVRYSDDLKEDEFENLDISGHEQELTDYLKAVKVRRTLSKKNHMQYLRLQLMLTCSSKKHVDLTLAHYGAHASKSNSNYVFLEPEKVYSDLLNILGIEDDFPFVTTDPNLVYEDGSGFSNEQ